jgi:hypothetical protein
LAKALEVPAQSLTTATADLPAMLRPARETEMS